MAATTAQSMGTLPSGMEICTTAPDIFYLPELVIGGLVWILVASTRVVPENPLGWVMFVSIFCFVGTTLWLLIFACGGNQSSFWPGLDAGFHFVAAIFYLSASVVLAYITIVIGNLSTVGIDVLKTYRLDISAVVMSHVATLLYFLHAIFSAIRWKRA
ncbi:myelin and lymphocyte protein-like isoform X1 [Xiphophorus hellerii]|uniref:myelin and lymphocyte protein-like isoform X1 n=1 Tax=Xiphophorus hellerii TaxID=8084 RepID=UPI0013B459D3|nr:myelin and lymphocyte protein-like isoform X1 [Xiphophorus hellerii]